MKKIAIAFAAAGLAAPVLAQEESQLSMEEVPQAAMEAAQAEAEAAGVTEFEGVAMDDDGGTQTYEFSATMENGMGFEVDVLEDGTVEEVEQQIEVGEVPQEVTATLEENLPGFSPEYIERSTREQGEMIVYEFEGQHEGGAVDVEINADGTNYMMNEDTAG